MKIAVTIAAVAAACSVSLFAFQGGSSYTLASEPFAYAAGALNGANGGSGWAASWQVQNSSTTVPGYNAANATQLTYSGIGQSGNYAIGGIAYQSAGRQLDASAGGAFSQYVSNGLIGASGQTLYWGLLMRKDMDTDDEMSVTLHPGGNPSWWAQSPGVAVGHFGGSSNTNGTRYWSFKLDGTVHQTTTPVVVGQPAFLVVRIDFAATSTVSLYVNPPAGSLPAPGAQATTTNSIAFQSVCFYGGSGTNQSSIDEIRFAGSYSAVASGALPPPAAPTNVSATPGNNQVSLAWNAVSGATGYQIYQVVNGAGQLFGSTSTNSFVATGLTNGASYTFYVVTQSASGTSAPSAQVTTVPHGSAPPPHPSLGTNLSQAIDYGREWPFVDAFKTARPWISQTQGGQWGQGPPLQVDSNGWITSFQPGQYAETIMLDNAIDDQADYPTGQYTLLYDGDGTITFDLQSASIVSQTPGRMVVNVPSGQNGVFLIVAATNPSNPIRNIRFIMPGFESTYQTQPFHPTFLQRLQNYQVLRFMEWMLTNGSSVKNWSDRPTPTDYTYSWRGIPLEVMIQLANTLNVKPWFNIPAQATDNYISQFATLVGQQLNSSLKFYVEYSNETWNGTFSQNAYLQSQGQALGLSTDPTLAAAYYNAYRAVQIFSLFQTALGGTSRMIRVIASQAANSWLSDQTLGFRNAYGSADALAIAPYFNCSDTANGGFGILGDPSTASQVAAMSTDQVIDIELQHINGCAMQQMQSNAAVAQKYGLKMVAYEGGQSLVGYGGAENNSALTAVFKAANRSTRMTSLYAQYLQNWVTTGGDVFVHYSDVSAESKYGSFGALEFQDQDPGTAPKYQALTTFAGQHP